MPNPTHVSHATCNSGEEPAFRIVDSDIQIGNMSMASFVKENVVWFKVAVYNLLIVKERNST